MQIQYFSVEIKTYQDFCDYLIIISDFCGFLDFFLDLDGEIMDFYNFLDRDFSSEPYSFTFCASKLASKWAKSAGNSRQKSRLTRKIMVISMVSISLNDLDKNLDTAKSQLKSLNFKNLDQEIKNFGLDTMDNRDGFQKLVSTDRDPQA
jgi:hypothetical protein